MSAPDDLEVAPFTSRLRKMLAAGDRNGASVFAQLHRNALEFEDRLLDADAAEKLAKDAVAEEGKWPTLGVYERMLAEGRDIEAGVFASAHGPAIAREADAREAAAHVAKVKNHNPLRETAAEKKRTPLGV